MASNAMPVGPPIDAKDRITFGTDGIRCLVNQEPLTPETTLKISKTFVLNHICRTPLFL